MQLFLIIISRQIQELLIFLNIYLDRKKRYVKLLARVTFEEIEKSNRFP